ncbi:MAG: hypothetical protein ABIG71_02235 [Candidatus Uhrbacteria bacterium]
MERRTKRIIGVVIIIVAVLVLVLVFRSRDAETTPEQRLLGNEQQSSGQLAASGDIAQLEQVQSDLPPTPPPPEVAIRQVAQTFAERFGSYSSVGKFVNITDSYPLMTDGFREKMREFVALRLQESDPSDTVSTMVTQALKVNVTLDAEREDRASASVWTQRVEQQAGSENVTSVKLLIVLLQRVEDQWLVSGSTWQE